jgi:hypothetical protein
MLDRAGVGGLEDALGPGHLEGAAVAVALPVARNGEPVA